MMKLFRKPQLFGKALPKNFSQAQFLAPRATIQFQKHYFGLYKYHFEQDDYDPNRFQVSRVSHKSNAEELINNLPIVEVDGNTARCLGVNEMGLGHPVQYIQLNRRNEHTPVTCKWCGLRFRKRAHEHHH